MNVRSG